MAHEKEVGRMVPILDRAQTEQLLREAECPEEFLRRFLAAMETASEEDQLRLLRCQRCRQLDRVHDEQRKLDGLDYLRYKLERRCREKEGAHDQ